MIAKKQTKKLLVVLPTYNESLVIEENVKITLDYLARELSDYDWRVLVADNCSTDETIKIVERLSEQDNRVGFFHLDQPGRGGALKKAWSDYSYDIMGYMDADLATDLVHLKQVIERLDSGAADIVIGSRIMTGSKTERSLGREATSRIFNFLLRHLLHLNLSDAQCGFKFINCEVAKKVVPQVKDKVWFFDTELLFLARQADYKIAEIPVAWVEKRIAGRKSTVKVFSTALDYLWQMWRLRKRS
jgi:glycosyltransferase involved in cell wall biosynthesis